MSRRHHQDGEQYIQMYPHLAKWINQCTCCQARGYNPDMPDIIGHQPSDFPSTSRVAKNIRKFFKPLAVNELGLCNVCCANA